MCISNIAFAEELRTAATFCAEIESFVAETKEGIDGPIDVIEICDRMAGSYRVPNPLDSHTAVSKIAHETAVPACRAALKQEPETSRFRYQLARALLASVTIKYEGYNPRERAVEQEYQTDRPEFMEAVGLLEELAGEGNAEARGFVGVLTENVGMIEAAAELDSSFARRALLLHCREEISDPSNKLGCIGPNMKASLAGDAESQFDLASLNARYATSANAEKRKQTIVDLLTNSANHNDLRAVSALIDVYNTHPRQGVERNIFGKISRPDHQRWVHWSIEAASGLGGLFAVFNVYDEVKSLGADYETCRSIMDSRAHIEEYRRRPRLPEPHQYKKYLETIPEHQKLK